LKRCSSFWLNTPLLVILGLYRYHKQAEESHFKLCWLLI
jgi:hypothetical protein